MKMKISFDHRRAIEDLYSPSQYVQTKSLKDIPDEVAKDIHLVSLKGEEAAPFGSYMNRIADYFGDIDVIQIFSGEKSVKAVGVKAAKAVQEMVKQIKSRPKYYFSEFKAGIDHPYYFDIGTLVEGEYRPSKDLKTRTEKLHYLKLLTDAEKKVVDNVLSKKVKTGDDYDAVFGMYRERFILRWTQQEVLQGFKTLLTGKYYLKDAVLDHAPVKIDMITINEGGKFIEVTNFMALGLKKGTKIIPINVDLDAMTPENLPVEIEKLYYSNHYYKPFKIVKRSFAYLKWVRGQMKKGITTTYNLENISEDYVDSLITDYAEILKSTINILYTVTSELDAMKLVLERVKSPPRKAISKRINLLKEPISNVLEIDDDNLKIIMALVDDLVKDLTVEKVKALMSIFKEIIDFWTVSYFDQLGINPPPRMLLPNVLSYSPNIIRNPWDLPPDPVKLALAAAEGLKGGFLKELGKSMFQKVANSYRAKNCDGKSRPLYKGEYHLGCHNFTGPGTRVDLKEVREFKPYNAIDACSKQHDLDYMKAVELPDDERKKKIIEADDRVLECYDKHKDVSGYIPAHLGINAKMRLGQVLPIVSRSIFGKISGGKTIGKEEFDKRMSKFESKFKYRPGEDPDVARQALVDAAKLVKSVFKEDPVGVVKSVAEIGKHLIGYANTQPEKIVRTSQKGAPPGYDPNWFLKKKGNKGGCQDINSKCNKSKQNLLFETVKVKENLPNLMEAKEGEYIIDDKIVWVLE